MPRSLATCRIGRFDSSASRTARSRNSNGYFLGAPIAGASPSPRTEPGSGASTKLRVLQMSHAPRADKLLIKPAAGARPAPPCTRGQIIPKARIKRGQSPDESHAARRQPGWQQLQTDRLRESYRHPSDPPRLGTAPGLMVRSSAADAGAVQSLVWGSGRRSLLPMQAVVIEVEQQACARRGGT